MKIRMPLLIPMIFISGTCLAQEVRTSARSSPVDFYSEKITLTLSESLAAISGTYYFRNNTESDSKIPIMFPFYIDSTSLFPDSIKAYIIDSNDTTNLDFAIRQNSIIIGIPLSPHQVTIWYLDYKQKIRDAKATYILTSTASWGKPLEDATYEFIVPASFKNVRAWPEPDTVIERGANREYRALRSDFMPIKNMEIDWELK